MEDIKRVEAILTGLVQQLEGKKKTEKRDADLQIRAISMTLDALGYGFRFVRNMDTGLFEAQVFKTR